MTGDRDGSSGPADSPTEGDGPTRRPDGGAAGADEVVLDPWGSATIDDYGELFDRFGIEAFEDLLADVPDPHFLMRRGIIFGHRDYRTVIDAMRSGDPFAVLSGFMPTGDPHIGHKMVFDEIVWHQRRGADAYGLIADLEAHSARGLSWGTIDAHARDYVLSLLALGFDPDDGELYRQSAHRPVQDLAFELGIEANFTELQAIYGFGGETSVSHLQSVVTQAADILYPQLDGPMPTVIPVGPDQDPHLRLTRDLAVRVRYFGVTEAYASFEATPAERELIAAAYAARRDAGEETPTCVAAADWLEREAEPDAVRDGAITKLEAAGREPIRPRVRFVDRKATEEAFAALIEAIDGEKRVYEAHVDAFELDRADAERLARTIEVSHGGYGFVQPASLYHRFMTGLTGGKMSSSVPASHISLLDDPETGFEKVTAATTGGRETAALQRELGGRPDECPVYELYAYLLAGDDDEYATRVYEECAGGDRLCGDCKEEAAHLMREFLEDHQAKREELEPVLDDLEIDLESSRSR